MQSHGAPGNAGSSARRPTWKSIPEAARAAGSSHTKRERELGSGLGRWSLPSFPLHFSPPFWYLLHESQSRALSRQLSGVTVPSAACRGAAGCAQRPPEAGGRGRCQQQGGKRDSVEVREGPRHIPGAGTAASGRGALHEARRRRPAPPGKPRPEPSRPGLASRGERCKGPRKKLQAAPPLRSARRAS